MKYLPFEEFKIHSKLSSDEVFYRLRAATDKERNWWFLANKPFWGKVYRHNFRIRRYHGWWRNYPPIVLGKIEMEDLGCCLQIKIRLPWFGYLFNFFMFEFLWFSFLIGNGNLIVQKIQTGIWQFESIGEWLLSIGAYIVFFAFLSLVPFGNFRSEARYVKEYLLLMSQVADENVTYQDRILGLPETQIIKAIFIIPIVVSVGWMMFKFLQ